MSEPDHRTFELSDTERRALAERLEVRANLAVTLGYALRGEAAVGQSPLIAQLPDTPAGELSVCGLKDFLVDEVRRFERADRSFAEVRCAAAAVLEMTDTPVHVHAATLEYYLVLAGSGKMVLGAEADERVVEVAAGSLILLPPGQPHGLVSDDSRVPVKALMTFTPGLAPKTEPEFRDEKILWARTSVRLRELGA